MEKYNVGILGATGAVGREMLKILKERSFPVGELRLLASKKSAGKTIDGHEVTEACAENFKGLDIVLGAAESSIAAGFNTSFVTPVASANQPSCQNIPRLAARCPPAEQPCTTIFSVSTCHSSEY